MWWDDYMVIIATLLLAVMAGVQIAGTELGFGLHYWNVQPSNSVTLIQLFYAGQQLYILVQVFAKISILLLFDRLFSSSRWFHNTIRWFILFLVLHGVIYMFLIIFECTPISSIWDLSNPDRTCKDITAIVYSGAAFSIIEDFGILLLPVPELLKLQLSTKKKVGLGLIFSLGSLKGTSEAAPLRRSIYYRKQHFEEITGTTRSTGTELSLSPVDTSIGDEIARELDWWDRLSLKGSLGPSNKV
ncbi:hypothetical protein COL940_008352 [Colletotrichum noveboracense]|nr:hypothetical protein COL940_008352 [Colletotrichum noveboracense]